MIEAIDLFKQYRTRDGTHQVLRGVSLSVSRGEKLAILGRNGAGKSTLIRLLGGVEWPTTGRITRRMTVSWPLGFDGGFQGSLTGHDNIRFVARIYGKQFQEIFDYVEDFAALGKHLKEPVKTYSSGMRARLAFGLSLAVDFECYLIDEVLAVGDHKFYQRCRQEIFEKRKNRAIILASHDVGIMNEYCDKALVLHQGRAKTFDDKAVALDVYYAL
jgi:capsular polysaccharide transport system ATP-binding protein